MPHCLQVQKAEGGTPQHTCEGRRMASCEQGWAEGLRVVLTISQMGADSPHLRHRLFSWADGSDNLHHKPAKTNWFQHGGQAGPNFTPKYITHSLTQSTSASPCCNHADKGQPRIPPPDVRVEQARIWVKTPRALFETELHLVNIHLPLSGKGSLLVPLCSDPLSAHVPPLDRSSCPSLYSCSPDEL